MSSEEKERRSAGFKKEIRARTIGYMVAAFGLVAGLAWNEAIKALIDSLFPLSKDSLPAKFIYAIIITIVVVIVSIYLVKFSEKSDGKKQD